MKAGTMVSFGSLSLRTSQCVLCAALLLFLPLEDTRAISAQALYEHAWQLFLHGDLAGSQQEAAHAYLRFLRSDPASASGFLLLEANSLVWSGMYENGLRALSSRTVTPYTPGQLILRLTIEGTAL